MRGLAQFLLLYVKVKHKMSIKVGIIYNIHNLYLKAGEKLCVIVWDAWEILVQRSSNHRHSKASYSTKHKMNAYHR